MELLPISSNPLSGSLKGSRKRRGYNIRYDGASSRKNMKIVRFGGSPEQRAWRIKVVPKLRLKSMAAGLSALKLWRKVKDGYVNMMLNLAGNGTAFGGKRIPKARQLPPASYAPTEFDNRLVLEIYKSLLASRELATTS